MCVRVRACVCVGGLIGGGVCGMSGVTLGVVGGGGSAVGVEL